MMRHLPGTGLREADVQCARTDAQVEELVQAWDDLTTTSEPVELSAEVREHYQQAVDRLPELQRAALLLWITDGLTVDQISQRLKVSTAEVSGLIATACRQVPLL